MEPLNSISFVFAPARPEPPLYQAQLAAARTEEPLNRMGPAAGTAGGPLYPTQPQPAFSTGVPREDFATPPRRAEPLGGGGRETLSAQTMIAPITGDPFATMVQAEEMITLAESGRPSEAEVRIASEAYLLEMQAQSDMEMMETRGPAATWSWFA
jgi:hypothetical protein